MRPDLLDPNSDILNLAEHIISDGFLHMKNTWTTHGLRVETSDPGFPAEPEGHLILLVEKGLKGRCDRLQSVVHLDSAPKKNILKAVLDRDRGNEFMKLLYILCIYIYIVLLSVKNDNIYIYIHMIIYVYLYTCTNGWEGSVRIWKEHSDGTWRARNFGGKRRPGGVHTASEATRKKHCMDKWCFIMVRFK